MTIYVAISYAGDHTLLGAFTSPNAAKSYIRAECDGQGLTWRTKDDPDGSVAYDGLRYDHDMLIAIAPYGIHPVRLYRRTLWQWLKDRW